SEQKPKIVVAHVVLPEPAAPILISLRHLDSSFLHNPFPLVELRSEKNSKLGRGSTRGLISDFCECILDLAVCKRLVHSRIQARDGPARRPILHGKSLKVFHEKTRESLLNHRRHILQGDDARRRYDRERAEFACEDEIDRPNRCNEIELDGTIEKID